MYHRKSQLLGFVVSFFVSLIVGFVILWLTDFVWGTEDPRFYQLVLPGWISGAFILALINSKQSNT